MSTLTCHYCGKEYEASDLDVRLAATVELLMWKVMRGRAAPPPVTCISHAGAIVRTGFAAIPRWNDRLKQIEILVIPGVDATKGRFWPVGLVLWHIEEDEHAAGTVQPALD